MLIVHGTADKRVVPAQSEAMADALKAAGARSIHAAATHGVLCGPAIERLRAAAIDSVVVTNTVALPEDKRLDKLTVLNVAPLFAAAIERIHSGQSVGALFE